VTARALLARAEAPYSEVVRPYLIGDDLADRPDQSPGRWVIDFASMPLEEAIRYPGALDIVRELVRPERETNPLKARRERWWQFGAKAVGMRAALAGSPRYVAIGRLAKRLNAAWQDAAVCPSDLVNVVAVDDDYSMGVLLSRAHVAWARVRGSSFKADPRYTPSTVFMTFPWPSPTLPAARLRIADASVALLARRAEICLGRQIGLTRLYNELGDGAYQDLAALHRELDEAVVACYGWPSRVAHDGDELVRRLLALNAEIARGARDYGPFAHLST